MKTDGEPPGPRPSEEARDKGVIHQLIGCRGNSIARQARAALSHPIYLRDSGQHTSDGSLASPTGCRPGSHKGLDCLKLSSYPPFEFLSIPALKVQMHSFPPRVSALAGNIAATSVCGIQQEIEPAAQLHRARRTPQAPYLIAHSHDAACGRRDD